MKLSKKASLLRENGTCTIKKLYRPHTDISPDYRLTNGLNCNPVHAFILGDRDIQVVISYFFEYNSSIELSDSC